MPALMAEETEPGRVEPPFQWETSVPHTVALMLNATERDLVLKACQSLFKFAHDGEINQNLLLQYDIVGLLLTHLQHDNRSVRRMAAMTLNELAANGAVQSVLLSNGGVVRLIDMLGSGDDCIVDEFLSSTLNKMATEPVGRARLLAEGAIGSLISRLDSADPDVIKNCLDALLAVLGDFQAVDVFVEHGGIERCLSLFQVEWPILLSLALEALRKAMYVRAGRHRMRDVGGLEDLLLLLETPGRELQHARAIAVLEHATLDAKNVQTMHRNGGLLRMVQLARASTEPDVLEQCGGVLGHLGQDEESRRALHELGAEAVIVTCLLVSPAAGSQSGAARAVAALAQLDEAQFQLTELGAVPLLLAMLAAGETSPPATRALAAITRGHEPACLQAADGLSRIVDKLTIDDEETAAHAAYTVASLAGYESTRSAVAAGGAMDRLLACLSTASAPLLVAACEALGVVSLSLKARRQLVEHGGVRQLLKLLDSESAPVRTAAVRILQVVAVDVGAAEQLCSVAALGSLRALRATSTLRIVLQVNLPALYSQMGCLNVHHRLSDGFFDVGRSGGDDAVPELQSELERPLSPSRLVFLLNSGVCHAQPGADQAQSPQPQKKLPSSRGGSSRRRRTSSWPAESEAPTRPEPPDDHRLAAYVAHVRAAAQSEDDERRQAAALAAFVAERLGGVVPREELATWSDELHLAELRRHLASNVLPVGEVERAGLRCRALLFKFLADQVFLPCTLHRGNYSKYWNTVLVAADTRAAPLSGVYCEVIVDLLHQPGRLMEAGTGAALEYTTGL